MCSQRSDQREDKGQRWCSLHVAFAGKHNMIVLSCVNFLVVRKHVWCFWWQEKSYAMEGNAEAERAGERAKKLEESSYF